MRLNEVINPINGIFSNIPNPIWDGELDPSYIDIELFTRIGNLDASPLVEFYIQNGVLNTQELSNLLYQRYKNNWERIYNAIKKEYDIMITTSNEYIRQLNRETEDLETRDLTSTDHRTDVLKGTESGSNTKTGSVTNASESTDTHNTTDTQTKNLHDVTTNSGTDATTDTFNDKHTTTNELTKTGSESHNGTDNATKNLNDTKAGTEKLSQSETHTGTDNTVTDNGKYGVGSNGLANESRVSANDTRNLQDSTDSTTTYNITEGHSGTDNHTLTDTLTFGNRKDSESGSDTHTGTNTSSTQHGLQTSEDITGTDTVARTGTDKNNQTGSDVYDVTDTTASTSDNNRTQDGATTDIGTVKNEGNGNETETFKSEGSSALRTYQALIQEELDGRKGDIWNFTNIIIEDVQSMIAMKIWRAHYE